MDEASYPVLVVGGGIGGSAAALRAAQYNLRTAWLLGDRETAKASRAKWVYNVDNMIGVHGDLVRAKALEALDGEEWRAAREHLERGHVHISTEDIVQNVLDRMRGAYAEYAVLVEEKAVEARLEEGLFAVRTSGGAVLRAESLVLATGCMDRQPRIKKVTRSGKSLDEIHWIYPYANRETLLYCIRCEGHLTRGTQTAVLGAREATAQIAMMLLERYGTRVVILTNGEELQASDETRRLLERYGIEVRTPRIVDLVDEPGSAKGAGLRAFVLEDGAKVEARFGLVAMGLYRVYNDLARQLGAELEPGAPEELQHVLVDERSSETSVRGLFAVGDVSRTRGPSLSMKQIYTAQEYAVRAVDTIDSRRRRARRASVLAAG